MSTKQAPEKLASQLDSQADWEIEAFFDGDCPLCAKEIALLRRWDRRQRIRFTDIAAPDFDRQSLGRTHDELMARMHGRLPDGSLVEGVEVFRRLYAAVGFRWPIAVSRWPLVRPLLDLLYRFFAKHRLRLTGRCESGRCKSGSCDLPARTDA